MCLNALTCRYVHSSVVNVSGHVYSPVVVFEFSYRAFTQLTSTLQFIVKRLLCTYLNNFCSVLTVLNTD